MKTILTVALNLPPDQKPPMNSVLKVVLGLPPD